jgi:AbrB family looped-hinge helix DNA binding protein
MSNAESIVKVNKNFQVKIPNNIRLKANIKEGSLVKIIYDEKEGVIKLIPFKRKRLTIDSEEKLRLKK